LTQLPHCRKWRPPCVALHTVGAGVVLHIDITPYAVSALSVAHKHCYRKYDRWEAVLFEESWALTFYMASATQNPRLVFYLHYWRNFSKQTVLYAVFFDVIYQSAVELIWAGNHHHGLFTVICMVFHFQLTQSFAGANSKHRLLQCKIEKDLYSSEAFNTYFLKEVSWNPDLDAIDSPA
jgi:hypothetical protein